jgi:hypothetical protein
MKVKMSDLYEKALKLGATEFGKSNRKGKRFYVIYKGKIIHFGSDVGSTFIDHQDKLIKKNWRLRHSKIIRYDGVPFYKIRSSPSYWAWKILW